MTESYRKLLFDNPGYKFTNVTKFLGEVSLDHGMAKVNLQEIEDNLNAFAETLRQDMAGGSGVDGCLDSLRYPLERLNGFLDASQDSGLSEKDACIFVYYMLHCYEELVAMAEEMDSDN
jgi:hypothetical protein